MKPKYILYICLFFAGLIILKGILMGVYLGLERKQLRQDTGIEVTDNGKVPLEPTPPQRPQSANDSNYNRQNTSSNN